MLDTLLRGGAAWFTAAALIGTGVFLIRLLFLLIGASHDLDTHADPGASGDGHSGHGIAGVLSVQGAAAFLMGFGWAGLFARSGLDLGIPASIGVGMGGGLLMCALLALLLRGVGGMETSGTFRLDQAAGLEGEVYAGVPACGEGRGQLRVVVSGRQRIVQAIAEPGQGAIPTGARARVVRVNSDNSVTVVKT